ncbi:hypothetical protein [Brevundimonas sp.]|uniref:hypothetical protein n=1 Tax=Brevundimonas sp. TaxID=1871086 RepID=UPI001A29D5E5|nr:hypothetical protein [Brevundimonas sp.]MBJ7484361.1 hypothetical protein [Brevundimonas sp.]
MHGFVKLTEASHGEPRYIHASAVVHIYRDPNEGRDMMVCMAEGARAMVRESIDEMSELFPSLRLIEDKDGNAHLVDPARIIDVWTYPLGGGAVVTLKGGDGLICHMKPEEILSMASAARAVKPFR